MVRKTKGPWREMINSAVFTRQTLVLRSIVGAGAGTGGWLQELWDSSAFLKHFPLSFSPLFLPPQLLGPTGTANRAARNAGNSSRVGACVKQTSEQMLTKKNVLWKPFLLLLFRCDDHSKDLGQMCERNSDTENTGYEKERSRKAMGRRCFYKRAFCIPAVNCLSFKSCFWEQQSTFFFLPVLLRPGWLSHREEKLNIIFVLTFMLI